ncbi:hypothetical protein CEUSTIGMA_g4966.t1 [Chlamydomonas eustigma]|uniref:Glycosyl transferase family 1 domain-containing protein n=1 Tax=Chlamydomonas eustigma TaxID=1157962 RepID=A0A250X3Q0_9CHLO|nr:hypothetical protein CEUSTIGMA_g4966.t1 [Chlamydomonas eustigma]|eukprot:GAX77522.1 hypothetical protein CEUSTIGMA_g4966.t1 [Chlamydomonas eustigma]
MLRIVFLTLEFSAGTFSGNGIYAQSQVRALSSLGYPVLVISGKPSFGSGTANVQGGYQLIEVPVSRWGKLDASTPYDEYASKGSSDEICDVVKEFKPDVFMIVDWSALDVYRNLRRKLCDLSEQPSHIPLVYLNYRVFSRTATGEDLALVSRKECEAMQEAILTIALSRTDQKYLTRLMDTNRSINHMNGKPKEIHVLLCALREDMRQLDLHLPVRINSPANPAMPLNPAQQQQQGAEGIAPNLREVIFTAQAGDDDTTNSERCGFVNSSLTELNDSRSSDIDSLRFLRNRPYLTCCVRLCQEKEPHRFVELVEELARRGVLSAERSDHAPVPLLIGAATDEYAQSLKQRLRAAAPHSIIIEDFMGPQQLSRVFSQTRLNVHPATYDAFGMTIVEAASQGAPSLVHDGGGAVGATDLLSSRKGEVILQDLSVDVQDLANKVELLLSNGALLLYVAKKAAAKARSWSEAANAAALVEMVQKALT